ncbi:hypothetical protein M942_09340 [Enterobacter ludwigii]|jgi:hypothetical protein|nr:hypothetical protein M942_09340 [Enterobacter ludwigii]
MAFEVEMFVDRICCKQPASRDGTLYHFMNLISVTFARFFCLRACTMKHQA